MALYLTLFLAGLLTILLPCILPLIPIVLGVSIVGRSKWRPLLTVAGMVLSFVGFTFLLLVVLKQFVELADYIHIATNYILLLFGIGFAIHNRWIGFIGAILGGLFFTAKGVPAVLLAMLSGILLLSIGSTLATRLQEFGSTVQTKTRSEFGADSPLTAFVIGLTLGLVWVPCAGPALGFALALVREKPGIEAALALTAYAAGTGLPLLLIGYGGQAVVHSVRSFTKYTGMVKIVAGILLIITAVLLQLNIFQDLQVWLASKTRFGSIGTRIEERIVGNQFDQPTVSASSASSESSAPSSSPSILSKPSIPTSLSTMQLPTLPQISRAPEFTGLGPWHNSEPLTLASLKGKVVLVDFWTYSCINCIRTLPYIQGYWDKYRDTGKFVIVAVHTPEFTFEKSEANVAEAIKHHSLTYPVAQDNDYGTWTAFANHYWPAKYLIDAQGYIRYTHFGEGNYEETDAAIASLLKEAGIVASDQWSVARSEAQKRSGGPISPETYVGARSWPAFGNSLGDPDGDQHAYQAPEKLVLNKYYLNGTWQLSDDQESQNLLSAEGEVRMRFVGGEMNLVLGLSEGSKPVQADIIVDGKSFKTVTIDRHDLFNLFTGDYGEHDVILKLYGKGVEAFAFTFG